MQGNILIQKHLIKRLKRVANHTYGNGRWGVNIFLTDPGDHPASYTRCIGSFPGVKRPESGADHLLHLGPRLNNG